MIRLENWAIVFVGPYSPPDAGFKLHGNVYGHPEFEDGDEVTTSTVIDFDAKTKTFTTYSGSVYELGTVDAKYEAQFPNAKERVYEKAAEVFKPHSGLEA